MPTKKKSTTGLEKPHEHQAAPAPARETSGPEHTHGSWVDVGSVEELARAELQQIAVGGLRIALSYRDGVFGAINGACNHAGGPLGKGHLEGDYVVCPWHQWRFHRLEGRGERGFEEDVVRERERINLRRPAAGLRSNPWSSEGASSTSVRAGGIGGSCSPLPRRRREKH